MTDDEIILTWRRIRECHKRDAALRNEWEAREKEWKERERYFTDELAKVRSEKDSLYAKLGWDG